MHSLRHLQASGGGIGTNVIVLIVGGLVAFVALLFIFFCAYRFTVRDAAQRKRKAQTQIDTTMRDSQNTTSTQKMVSGSRDLSTSLDARITAPTGHTSARPSSFYLASIMNSRRIKSIFRPSSVYINKKIQEEQKKKKQKVAEVGDEIDDEI